MARIAIFHPTDPAGHVPGGIDSFIKGILRRAPDDLDYTLFGASSELAERPVGKPAWVMLGGRRIRFLPIVSMPSSATRGGIPLSIRYTWALRRLIRQGAVEDFDILDFHRIEPTLLFRRDPRPKNVTLHADYAELRDSQSDIMWRHAPWLYERLEAIAFPTLARVYSVRQTAIERYKRTYPNLASRFLFTPTWFDSEVFHPTRDSAERGQLRTRLVEMLGIDGDSRLLVFVGRLDHQKDPNLLLDAFSEVLSRRKRLHLLIIGDGTLRPEIETRCSRAELRGQVSLLGVQRATGIADVLRACDLFVLSSAYEGMSIAVLEALASGLPVVSTEVGEVRLVVDSGVNGQVSRDRSPAGFADAICQALDQLEAMRGPPCEAAAAPYHPEKVLEGIYENHRMQHGRVRK